MRGVFGSKTWWVGFGRGVSGGGEDFLGGVADGGRVGL